ncbi:MAG: Maf family protein, partial [Comamonas sp.]
TPLPGETPLDLSLRLSRAKALAVAALHPGAIVIGSDQVPELDGQPLSKPGTHERATEQLRQMSGRQMNFHTGVCVTCAETGFTEASVVTVQVRFRQLNDAEIERYLRAEQPYDCAGSAKSEGLGIALLDAIVSDDPTALIGLPLIRTCQLLRAAGVVLP